MHARLPSRRIREELGSRSWTYREINVGGTQNVLCAGAEVGVKRVVITSSVLTMGFSNGHPLHENEATTAPLPTEYAESKREAEHVALLMCHEGPEVVIVNPTRVYGPGRMTEGNSVTRMIKLHLAGRFPLILGDGSATGNYAYVRDVARGHLLAMSKGRPGQRYILGGENVSFKQLFEIVRGVSGAHRLLAGVPESLALALGRFEEFRARHIGGYPMITPGWVRTFLMEGAYSSNKAEAELGYVITPLTAGIRETITWLNGDDEAPHPEDVDYRSFPQSLAVASGV